jgi:hypothetical protein
MGLALEATVATVPRNWSQEQAVKRVGICLTKRLVTIAFASQLEMPENLHWTAIFGNTNGRADP